MDCPRCHTPSPAGAKFCAECGQRLAGHCPACGAAAVADAPGCGSCGQSLTAPTPARPARAALEDERKHVTVLFADVKSSMELIVEQDPEEARTLLDPALQLMIDAVHRYGGTVNQVMGDGVMALFGAPRALEDHAVRACHAALAMQAGFQRMARQQDARRPSIRIRVGLNAGEVVVRTIGSDVEMDYTAVGQTTHLAARMEQLAPPGSIFLTGNVVQLAQGLIDVRPLGPMPVKGLDAPLDVFELVGATPHAARGLVRASAGFIGRAEALERLRVTCAQAADDHGATVALVGDAGTGKSRLCDELLRSSGLEDWLVLRTAVPSYAETTTYLPLVDILRNHLHVEPGENAERVRERAGVVLGFLDEDHRRALLILLDVISPKDELLVLDPTHRRERVMAALESWLLGEATRHPVALVIENLQWVDRETAAFLDRLALKLPSSALVLVGTYRPEYRPPWASRPECLVVPVEALNEQEAGELLRPLLGDDSTLDPLKTRLIAATGGNPFFLEASVRALVDGGALVGAPGAYRLERPLHAISIPATVHAVVSARIDRLPTPEKSLLQAAAVIGTRGPVRLLEALADLPSKAFRTHLRHLHATRFLERRGAAGAAEFAFVHLVEQEVAYGSLLRSRRRTMHARVVAVLEAPGGAGLPVEPERLAHHAERGEVTAKAALYHRQAGARALSRSANHQAVSHFHAALAALAQMPETRETLEQLVDVRLDLRASLLQLGQLKEALTATQEAETIARRLDDDHALARVYTYLVNYHYMKGEPDLALPYGERCLASAESADDPALVLLARQYIGQSLHAEGRYRDALAVLERNVRAFADASDTSPGGVREAASHGWLAWTAAELGEFEVAERSVAAAEQIAETSTHPYSQAIAWSFAGLVHLYRGRIEGAILPLARSVETCQTAQLVVWQPIPWALLGLALVRVGCVKEGLPLLERAVHRSAELGIHVHQALWTSWLAEALTASGRLEEARQTAASATVLALTHKERGHHAWVLRTQGEIALSAGALDEATRHLEEATTAASELGMQVLEAWCHDALARARERAIDRSAADRHRALAAQLFTTLGIARVQAPRTERPEDLGHLFVVARERAELYDFLAREFARAANVTVMMDRRQRDRRLRPTTSPQDRRHDERRRERHALRTWGLAILPRAATAASPD